jgi:hypothetical protein
MKNSFPELGLERLLASLERDLLAAGDDEIAEGAGELGLKPDMKGSVALFGVTSTVDVSRFIEMMRGRMKKKSAGPTVRRRSKDEPPPT